MKKSNSFETSFAVEAVLSNSEAPVERLVVLLGPGEVRPSGAVVCLEDLSLCHLSMAHRLLRHLIFSQE